MVVEAGLLVGLESVSQSGGRHSRHQRGQKADDQGCEVHRGWRIYGRAGSSIWGNSRGDGDGWIYATFEDGGEVLASLCSSAVFVLFAPRQK